MQTEDEKEFSTDLLKMFIWQYKMFQYHTELRNISDDLEKVFIDPRLKGHPIKEELLSIQTKLDDLLMNLTP